MVSPSGKHSPIYFDGSSGDSGSWQPQPQQKLGEVLVGLNAISEIDLKEALIRQKARGTGLLGDILIDMGKCEPTKVAQALAVQKGDQVLKRPLGEILVANDRINRDQLDEALSTQRNEGGLLGSLLIDMGHVEPIDIAEALREQLRSPTTVKTRPSVRRRRKPIGRVEVGPDAIPIVEPDAEAVVEPKVEPKAQPSIWRQVFRLSHVVPIFGLTYFWLWLWPPEGVWHWSAWYKWVWLIPLPFAIGSIVGLVAPIIRQLDPRRVRRPVRKFYILVVTRGTNVEAAKRSYDAMRKMQNDLVKLVFVTDEPLPFPHLMVPKEFKPRRAKAKARALEYFRLTYQLTSDDWVLHLDEESVIDQNCLDRCLEFARHSPALWGQGLILYNQHDWWKHPLIGVADSIRVGDDLGRFNFQYAHIHRPIFGAHGSFLLTSGVVENAVTWDWGGLTEDFEFAMRCMELGLPAGKVDGVVREQSPQDWRDFLKQRKRWFCGIKEISRPWPRLWWLLWMMSPLSLIVTIFNFCLPTITPWSIGIGGAPTFSTYLYLYFLGALIQDLDRKSRPRDIILHSIHVLLLFPIAAAMESIAVIQGLLNPPKTFEVVKK